MSFLTSRSQGKSFKYHIWGFKRFQYDFGQSASRQPPVTLEMLESSYSLEAGIKFFWNQILCIHTKFQPNRPMGTPPNKLCNIIGYLRPKWRSNCNIGQISQLILKIQVLIDINSVREVRRHIRHPFKRCKELGSFTQKCNIELAIKSAD